MTSFERTTSENSDFQYLIALLDADLAIRDGADHAFYNQYNGTGTLQHVIVCYIGNKTAGCGALREFDKHKVEIKRMFVLPECRGHGIGAKILRELEIWAAELNYRDCVLETGKNQPEAIRLYKKSGYTIIQNYGPYESVENSVCMAKGLLCNRVNNK